ncbi:hypothetical protein QYM36_005190 [Artemia franciscana]|uniref:Glycosylphosphatidylinositol anchor attachment 1 protein n=1 Tax=Artemia franciscana TaxID=6661 RepID=A0AA88I7A5_ARTSF|nr:hypothetical protein QYM36_005190 [Artemia franciscana]
MKNNRSVCYLLYVFGLVGFFSLANEFISSDVYISDNGLLPGLVQSQFKSENVSKEFLAGIKEEIRRSPEKNLNVWIASQFQQLGLDVSTQNFVLQYNIGPDINLSGKNIYGILRARRHSSKESLVLAAPYRQTNSTFTDTNGGIALMLALAKELRSASFLAKDIIFLISDHEYLGVQAWLEAYHRVAPDAGLIYSEDLQFRAGSIQAALNLEIPQSVVSRIDIKIQGLNGQFPNLDLINLAHLICRKENIQSSFQNLIDSDNESPFFKKYLGNIRTMLLMMLSQATGIPTGNHGLFHQFGIDAITLTGYFELEMHSNESESESEMHSRVSYQKLGRVLEGIVRSLNNLQERFHRSFFFYILSGTNRFISISVYIIPFLIMVASLLLRALSSWSSIVEFYSEGKYSTHFDLDGVIGIVVLCHLIGSCSLLIPSAAVKLGLNYFNLDTAESVYYGFLFLSVTVASLFMFPLKTLNAKALRCIAHIEMVTLMLAIAVQNISLAALLAFFVTPFFLGITNTRSRKSMIFNRLVILFTHPLVILHMVLLLHIYISFPEGTLTTILLKSFTEVQRSMMDSIMDSYIYGNKIYYIIILFYFPIWILNWLAAGQNESCCISC